MTPPNSQISDELLADLYRGTPAEARTLALALSTSDRARLAIVCNAKAHLRAQGREIAGLCTEASLLEIGGLAGAMLHRQLKLAPDSWGGTAPTGDNKISLGELRSFGRTIALHHP